MERWYYVEAVFSGYRFRDVGPGWTDLVGCAQHLNKLRAAASARTDWQIVVEWHDEDGAFRQKVLWAPSMGIVVIGE